MDGRAAKYVNEAAGSMFGGVYLELFGRATHELVAADLTAQSEWAYAVQKVEESARFSASLPQLEFNNLAGQKVIAKDVTMWRVDSLEDTPIGMAVLVKSWQRG
ncbi:hypothetical protein OEZ86_009793 [Tetradesmus obliquus]|uniref:MEKHLA domain-containing protein n=1 Tax=Tetradesmus obliquus TaxID=3088 RepID=A0ABY8UNI0_TETOB|nr:hypothetical protein OEZ85_001235 [Tetradesmus obliquus]WIA43291.1 hypothetical protein OEZ86_009793 [Tetradesmus obliquus]